MMMKLLKIACLATYALALAGLLGWLPPTLAGAGSIALTASLALLAIHALELALMFKHVRSYPGSLAASVALTLLFGLMHWKPLAEAQARAKQAAP
jgi:uncharacterized protein YhhL (DUF1145 family)